MNFKTSDLNTLHDKWINMIDKKQKSLKREENCPIKDSIDCMCLTQKEIKKCIKEIKKCP